VLQTKENSPWIKPQQDLKTFMDGEGCAFSQINGLVISGGIVKLDIFHPLY
jgi:hypothetical protein